MQPYPAGNPPRDRHPWRRWLALAFVVPWLVVALTAVSACSRGGPEHTAAGPRPSNPTPPGTAVGGSKPEDKEPAKDPEMAAITATVRCRDKGECESFSGAIVGKSGALVYVLVASHCLSGKDIVEVETFSAKSY